jgi:hypothetical protein
MYVEFDSFRWLESNGNGQFNGNQTKIMNNDDFIYFFFVLLESAGKGQFNRNNKKLMKHDM